MLIKAPSLGAHLQKNMQPMYVLLGQDHYLLNDAALTIKSAWRQRGESDEKTIHINSTADWAKLIEEANSYSLFTEYVLLDVRFDKKTIDALGKETLSQYLLKINSRTLIILRAANMSAKQLPWLTSHNLVLALQVFPLSAQALQQWILAQLQSKAIRHDPQIPTLIHQYTQGNMLACAQVIERLALTCTVDEVLTAKDVVAQLVDQCDYQLYELADACLTANTEKAIHHLRQANNHHTEPTLILWLLAQEIRLLIQLAHLQQQAIPFNTACSQLKIWPQRSKSYQMTLSRLSQPRLYQLLQTSQQLDERIKSGHNQQIWQLFEQIALALCLGDKHPALLI